MKRKGILLDTFQTQHVYPQLFDDTIGAAGKQVHPTAPKQDSLGQFPA